MESNSICNHNQDLNSLQNRILILKGSQNIRHCGKRIVVSSKDVYFDRSVVLTLSLFKLFIFFTRLKYLVKYILDTKMSQKGQLNHTKTWLFFFFWSAYEVKNNCCLFERLFKVKKNGVFLFGISFFVQEIFTFLYYASKASDDVIGGSTKTVQHSIKNTSRSIKAVVFKRGTRNIHHQRNKMISVVPLPWQQLCRWSCFN